MRESTCKRPRDLELNKTSLFIGTKPRRRRQRKLKHGINDSLYYVERQYRDGLS